MHTWALSVKPERINGIQLVRYRKLSEKILFKFKIDDDDPNLFLVAKNKVN